MLRASSSESSTLHTSTTTNLQFATTFSQHSLPRLCSTEYTQQPRPAYVCMPERLESRGKQSLAMGKYTSTLRQWLTPDPTEGCEDCITSRGVEWDARGVMKSCLFCEYAAQTKEKKLVYEDDDVVAFAPAKVSAKQHLLVIPRRHISTVGDLIASDAELLDRMRNVAERILKCHDASKTQFSFQIPPWNSIGEPPQYCCALILELVDACSSQRRRHLI